MYTYLMAILTVLIAFPAAVSAEMDTLWTKRFPGLGARSIHQTADGGYAFVHGVYNLDGTECSIHLVKTDPEGEAVWTRSFGDVGLNFANSLLPTQDDGYVIAGTNDGGVGETIYLVKTDSNGDTLWTRRSRDIIPSAATDIKQTADGGFVIAGWTALIWNDNRFLLGRINPNGDFLGTKVYPGPFSQMAYAILQPPDGGYIVATKYGDLGEMVKVSVWGDVVWMRVYEGALYSMQATDDGGYIAAGSLTKTDPYSKSSYLVKTDSQGDIIWQRTYGEWPDQSEAFSVQQTSDGGYILAGYRREFLESCVHLIKTNQYGVVEWERNYRSDFSEAMAYDVRQTADGGFIVAGAIINNSAETECWLLRLGEMTSMEEETRAVPSHFEIQEVYPNPFNSQTRISYGLDKPGEITLTVCNLLGQTVYQTQRKHSAAGNYAFLWDASDYASGTYLVQLTDDSRSVGRKVSLVK